MSHWAKLSEDVGKDGKLAELAEENTLAALLFTWSLAAADVYGILPANVREYKARVCPATMLDAAKIEQAIAAQEAVGIIELYEAKSGKPLLYIRNYHKYQIVNWFSVRAAEYELPDTWQVPVELQTAIDSGKLKKSHKIFGGQGVQALSQTVAPGEGDGSPRVAPPMPPGSPPHAPMEGRGSRIDVDVDVDLEEDVDKDKDTHTDVDLDVDVSAREEDQEENPFDDIPSPSEANMFAAHGLSAAVQNAQPSWTGRMQIINPFCRSLQEAICDKGDPDFTEASVFAALKKWPPRARDSGRDWLKYVAGQMYYEKNPRGKNRRGILPPSDLSQMEINADGTVTM